MVIIVSLLGIETTILITTFIIHIIVLNNQPVVAELTVVPLWNVTANQTYADTCDLRVDTNRLDVVEFTGDTVQTCSVQLIASNGTTALIQIPQDALLYVERQENVLDCQKKYVSVTADEPCIFVSQHPKLQLFLHGNSDKSSGIAISNIPVDTSFPICLDDVNDLEQYGSQVSQTKHCQINEYNHLISCNLTPDNICSFDFPGNCNATLGYQNVKFQCSGENLYNSLIVYPTGIITLDLSQHSIININENSFKALNSLNELYLSRNKVSSLTQGIFNGLQNLTVLYLDKNDLTVLSKGLFWGISNLNELHLDWNHINSLDENLFNETNKLTYLSLWSNNLAQLPNRVFWCLTNLNTLDLDNNDLTVLPNELFIKLHNLEYLYLSGNQINSLDDNMFNWTNKLTYLSLEDNILTILPEGLFRRLENLKVLHLSFNLINSLSENLLNEIQKLTYLYLRENNLTLLPNNLFWNLGNLIELDLDDNALVALPKELFMELHNLEYLHLRGNHFNSLDENLFIGLKNLLHLFLNRNQINSLHENLFDQTKQLTYLSFYDNKLVQLSNDLFKGLSKLQALDLDDNNIIDVNEKMFRDLTNLRYLYLSNNRFKVLNFNLFQYTRKIRLLDLSGNELVDIADISNLWQIFYLSVKDNKMTSITNKTFSNLPKDTDLVVSQHEICECYVPDNIFCTAADDRSPFLTCDRLLSDRVLVVVMWLIGLNAIGGNIFVLSQRKSKADKNKVQNFLIGNLAVSDLLMGVYMLLIASADIYFGQYFPMQAETWRSGIMCRVAGTLAIVSSEASVFFVSLITFDRFLSIRYHSSRRKLGQISSVVVATVLWIIALILAIAPSSLAGKNDKFYDNSHVCIGLPLSKLRVYKTDESEDWVEVCSDDDICYWEQPIQSQYLGEVNGMVFASVMFLGLNLICYLAILACYVEIIRTVFKSSKRAGLNPEMKEQIRLTAKVAAIVITDFACWFPIIIIGIFVQAGAVTLPPDVFAWCVTFVLPINSAINPYLYTIAAIINSRLKRARIAPADNQQENTSRRGQIPQSQNTQDTHLRHESNV